MSYKLIIRRTSTPAVVGGLAVPELVARMGDVAATRFLEFFAATIRNRNTRAAYARALAQFLAWLKAAGFEASPTSCS